MRDPAPEEDLGLGEPPVADRDVLAIAVAFAGFQLIFVPDEDAVLRLAARICPKLIISFTICRCHPIVRRVLNQETSLDRVFRALADVTRRDMVTRLTRGPASVSELAKPLDMSLPAVMQHLQVLEACGLVRFEKSGRVRTCHIEPGPLRMAEAWIGQQRCWRRSSSTARSARPSGGR